MDIDLAADEILEAVRTTIPGGANGLRGVFKNDPGSMEPTPAFALALPEAVEFDQTYGRSSDRITWNFVLVTGRLDSDNGRLTQRVGPFISGSGPRSIKAAIENWPNYTAFHTIRITRATTSIITYGTIDYQGVVFEADIFGQGAIPEG